ncbi:MAG: hypothetical protein DCF15_16290 [Phormidesmis priestleyi]|uniref:DUF4279 domain-containing protein n=1 Tax=Phormidesmis priestleyi TaxID=268141 RepID=A0A2W4WYP4_9CYAN|nr:MAG: hypothetical protein DCF15_16290 [Phormidesmis priestleyi]
MPINIYHQTEDDCEPLVYLCADDWDLPSQIFELENWLTANISSILGSSYIADLGFHIREAASGGGAVVSLKLMKMMTSIGMELYLSEYPN